MENKKGQEVFVCICTNKIETKGADTLNCLVCHRRFIKEYDPVFEVSGYVLLHEQKRERK